MVEIGMNPKKISYQALFGVIRTRKDVHISKFKAPFSHYWGNSIIGVIHSIIEKYWIHFFMSHYWGNSIIGVIHSIIEKYWIHFFIRHPSITVTDNIWHSCKH